MNGPTHTGLAAKFAPSVASAVGESTYEALAIKVESRCFMW